MASIIDNLVIYFNNQWPSSARKITAKSNIRARYKFESAWEALADALNGETWMKNLNVMLSHDDMKDKSIKTVENLAKMIAGHPKIGS